MSNIYDMVTGEFLNEPERNRPIPEAGSTADLQLGLQEVALLEDAEPAIAMPNDLTTASLADFLASQN